MPIVAAALGLILLLLFGKVLMIPIKIIVRLIINGIAGAILLFFLNALGGWLGLSLKITWLNALVAGFFGLPGVIVLLLIR